MKKLQELIANIKDFNLEGLSVEQTEKLAHIKGLADEAVSEETALAEQHQELQNKYKEAIFGRAGTTAPDDVSKELTEDEAFNKAINDVMNKK